MKIKSEQAACLLSLFVILLLGSTCHHPDPARGPCGEIDRNDIAAIVACVQSAPKEDILATPEVKDYLSKHKVYISLTTSPKRITKILPVLQTLDLELVTNVLLVLPLRFSRDNSNYVIPREIETFHKLKVLKIETDLGPITKLLPAVVYVNNTPENQKANIKFVDTVPNPDPSDPKAIVITIDDDAAYYYGSISQLIKYAILKDAVVGGRGRGLYIFNLDRANWPERTEPQPKCITRDVSGCDILEGVGSVAYPARYVDVASMAEFSKHHKPCRSADDLVINFVLANHKPHPVPKFMISNSYIYAPVPLAFGFESDALHLGAGGGSQTNYAHTQNYPNCLREINKEIKDGSI